MSHQHSDYKCHDVSTEQFVFQSTRALRTYGENGADDSEPEESLFVADVDIEKKYLVVLSILVTVLDLSVRPP